MMQAIKSITFAFWQKFRLRYGKKTKSILYIAFYIPKVLLGKKKLSHQLMFVIYLNILE